MITIYSSRMHNFSTYFIFEYNGISYYAPVTHKMETKSYIRESWEVKDINNTVKILFNYED